MLLYEESYIPDETIFNIAEFLLPIDANEELWTPILILLHRILPLIVHGQVRHNGNRPIVLGSIADLLIYNVSWLPVADCQLPNCGRPTLIIIY